MIKELIENEKQYLANFFQHVSVPDMEKFLELLYACTGHLILTGVGKSGLVAKKIAVTMTSTGTRASYLSPTDALHGDLGIVSPNDLFIMLSKSGETDELLNLIPFLRNKGSKILSIVSNGQSRLAHASDFTLVLPLERELCPFDMAPTTSTTLQMIAGDILTIGLMRLKNFTLDAYAMNHPAGRIGKRITFKVKDLMITGEGIPLCRPQDKLGDTLVELSNKRCGCVVVVDEQQMFQGIFTDGDLRRALQNKGVNALETPIHEIMTLSAKWIGPSALAWDAVKLMEADQKRPITVLPVLEEDSKSVIGIIKMHDIVQSGI